MTCCGMLSKRHGRVEMTTNTFFGCMTSIVADLSRDLQSEQRFSKLLDAVRQIFPCDATALLKVENEFLVPMAVNGLSADTMGRRFEIAEHPRFEQIITKRSAVRFAANSDLPDPYDGLIDAGESQLNVHDCLGVSLYIDDMPWGVLTLDALDPGTFDEIDNVELQTFIHLTEAAVKAAERIEGLAGRFERERALTRTLIQEKAKTEIIGNSRVINNHRKELDVVAQSNLAVLVLGETGVGKELVAHYIHRGSPRANRPMVYINCAALPVNIAESELFGHVKGAYSGATSDRAGKFEIANGATLFLDEIGELPLSLQAKMLRVLQNGEIQRVGCDDHVEVDVRIIAATNRDLDHEVKNGNFRADLFHRLSVYPINVPPLRERGRDVLLIAGYFLEGNQQRLGLRRVRLDDESEQQLLIYQWPGNVRELKHLLSRASLRAMVEQKDSTDAITISPRHLGIEANGMDAGAEHLLCKQEMSGINVKSLPLRDAIDQFQTSLIEEKLAQHNNNLASTAKELGLDRGNFSRLIKRLNIR